ncbi:hypothetical protein X888_629 [Burkholderia pseudomallei MSHR4377]|uniref:hypothetical protein n=1 Tax=Burkholderia pseudomallei TaxID=28450 RepID=UPI0005367838|nr:hypothetical protein [Burkholderia pseudomallei]KGU94991.1 hypothetical protein X888_629 [Burkholderia pseudomallei MSHR4377]
MTVSVAGKLIPLPNALSDIGRLALAFVDGGMEWLVWAATAPSARYDFADETELIATVQQGLHASHYTLLPQLGLIVSPVKLMTLSLADLNILARAESGDGSSVVAAQVAKILSEHGLVTRDEAAAGVSFLVQLGVRSAPLFQALGFDDSLAIANLMHLPQGARQQPLLQEAASFALKQARTVLEFCDFYRFYLDYAEQLNSSAATAERREVAASEALGALLPILFGALDCPQMQGLAGPADVAQAVRNWLAQGRMVGFARLSQGAQQIVQHTAYKGETGEAAKRIVELFMHAAQSFLAAHQPERGTMGQDGATCLFSVESAQLRAELQLSSGGVISLNDFGARRAAPAMLAPAAPENATEEQESIS